MTETEGPTHVTKKLGTFAHLVTGIDSDVAKASVFVAERPLEVFEVLSGAGSLQSIRLVELEHSPLGV